MLKRTAVVARIGFRIQNSKESDCNANEASFFVLGVSDVYVNVSTEHIVASNRIRSPIGRDFTPREACRSTQSNYERVPMDVGVFSTEDREFKRKE